MSVHRLDPPPDETPTERQAREWFARKELGLSDAEEKVFEAWLSEDPERKQYFEELEDTSSLLDRLQELPIAQGEPDHHVFRTQKRWIPGAGIWLGAVAASGIFVLGYLAWWRPNHFSAVTETAVGDLEKTSLPDGSKVAVNTDTRLQIAFSPEQRTLKLDRGEAYFSVAKDASRPFVVEASGVVIRAIGTAFAVKLQPGSVEVLVSDGAVQIEELANGNLHQTDSTQAGKSEPMIARIGEKVRIDLSRERASAATPIAPQRLQLPAVEVQRQLSWQARRLDFEDALLPEIVEQFNRYNKRPIVINDESLRNLRFGGTFRPDDPDSFLRMLRSELKVEVTEDAKRILLRAGN